MGRKPEMLYVTPEQKEQKVIIDKMIETLAKLDQAATKAPWHIGGQPTRTGRIYKLNEADEVMVIYMRNHLKEIITLLKGYQDAQASLEELYASLV
jgi:hypothetical protein